MNPDLHTGRPADPSVKKTRPTLIRYSQEEINI